MSDRNPKAFNPPSRIFLQVGEIEQDCEFKDCYASGEVTWEKDRIFQTDIEYRLVRPSRHKRRGQKS